jgi:Pyruvate/2-oxoacid:ferredoxin oxidoreductase delta subunit
MVGEKMSQEVYRQLLEVMKERRGRWAGMDIPEFFRMVEELFTPEEAEVNNALPKGPTTAKDLAVVMRRDEGEIEKVLESMANKGLCAAGRFGGTHFYQSAPFAIGIFEWQFMRRKSSERDKKLARLIHDYKMAYEEEKGSPKIIFPALRVIPVSRTIAGGNTVHTYDQVQTYIDKYDQIAVSNCYCRNEARLLGKDIHGVPLETCMTFGMAAQFAVERLGARNLNKQEARELLNQAEEAGLVHSSINTTEDIQFLCNCDQWNCIVMQDTFKQPRPAFAFNSRFQPRVDPKLCVACRTCISRCPSSARSMEEEGSPKVNLDRCIGCAVCATGCPSGAIAMESRPGLPEPPRDMKALMHAIKANRM